MNYWKAVFIIYSLKFKQMTVVRRETCTTFLLSNLSKWEMFIHAETLQAISCFMKLNNCLLFTKIIWRLLQVLTEKPELSQVCLDQNLNKGSVYLCAIKNIPVYNLDNLLLPIYQLTKGSHHKLLKVREYSWSQGEKKRFGFLFIYP